MYKRWMIVVVCAVVVLSIAIPAPIPAQAQQNGAFGQMLSLVPDNAISRTVIRYGAQGDMERIMGWQINSVEDFATLSADQQRQYLSEIGRQVYYSPFSGLDDSVSWRQAFGFDSFTIDREIVVGVDPDWYAILEGAFSASQVTTALANLGYQASGTIYALGNNGQMAPGTAGSLAGPRYNRLAVSDSRIIAAPADTILQPVLNGGGTIAQDPAYSALVDVLESPNTVPGTELISAGLFNGTYMHDEFFSPDPLSAARSELGAGQLEQLRNQLGLQNEALLPRYETVGLGYRHNGQDSAWVIALVYSDAGTAATASAILTDRLGRYFSFYQPNVRLFEGWGIQGNVVASGQFQVVVVTMQPPAQSDVAWVQLMQTKDLGFLATE